jgi:hypothetical protein
MLTDFYGPIYFEPRPCPPLARPPCRSFRQRSAVPASPSTSPLASARQAQSYRRALEPSFVDTLDCLKNSDDGQTSLDSPLLQHYCCKMIPAILPLPGSPWAVLPPGVHHASLTEVEATFATNPWRRELFGGLVDGLRCPQSAGCQTAFLDGSYVTGKPRPTDFDVCWDPLGVDISKVDPVFLDFGNGRSAQKALFKGEFLPSSMVCANVGRAFVEFFQLDRFTGNRKGIISISLIADPVLLRRVQP